MQISGYRPQNRLYHYKSYCKYSLLYEAVMRCTKDLNEVTKGLKSLKSLKGLILSFHAAAGRQRKDIASHVGCSKVVPVSRVTNAVALKGWAVCRKQKKTPQDDRQLYRIAETNRFSRATQLFQLSQKWSCVFGARSLYCR